jgi:MYXO-CTERM domain-containing protein
LTQLESQGVAAAAQENLCVQAQGRVRASLPYPSLTAADRSFVAFWLGGLYWRMRGGGLIPLGQTQPARIDYVQDGFGQIGNLLAGADGLQIGVPFVTELATDGWSQWMAMGTNGDDKYADLIGMTERGQRQAESATLVLQPLGYDTAELLTGGLQMGPGYYYGYYPLGGFRFAINMPPPYSNFMDAPTAIGEFNMGTVLGLGLARSLLPGKSSDAGVLDLCAGLQCGSDGCGGSCGTCATGLFCSAGLCGATPPPVDAGVDAGLDAGASADAGVDAGHDAGVADAGTDGGTAGHADAGADGGPDAGESAAPDGGDSSGGENAGGCSCGSHSTGGGALFPSLIALLVVARRRRTERETERRSRPG